MAGRNTLLVALRKSRTYRRVGLAAIVVDERDQEVQRLATEAAAEPLTYRVGPGRPDRSSKNSHSEVRHLFVELLGEAAISVVECFAELLQRPFRRRMGGDIVMEDFPSANSMITNT